MKLDDFVKESIKLIDSEDINRELRKCNYKFSKDLLQKDIEIEQTIKKISSVNQLTNEMNEKNNTIKLKLNKLLDSLS
ncbi:MAG TPA: hypothetical protein PLM63_02845 [bacterium]|jgi:hypothetical protein|nr:hypothetical protein [bacterium]